EHLPQRHVERPDAAADGRGKRPFDAYQKFFEGFDRIVRQPVIEFVLGRFPRKNFEPDYLPFAAVGLLDRRVKNALAGGPNVRPSAIPANKRQHWIIRNAELSAF